MRPLRFRKTGGKKPPSRKPQVKGARKPQVKALSAKKPKDPSGIRLRQILQRGERLPFSVVRGDGTILYEMGDTFTKDAYGKIHALLPDSTDAYEFVDIFELDVAETRALKEFKDGETKARAEPLELDPATLTEEEQIESGAPYRCGRGWLSVHRGTGELESHHIRRLQELEDDEFVLVFSDDGETVLVSLGTTLIWALSRRQRPTIAQLRWLEERIARRPPVVEKRDASLPIPDEDAPEVAATQDTEEPADEIPVRPVRRTGPRPAAERKKAESYFTRSVDTIESTLSADLGSQRRMLTDEHVELQREVVGETFEMVLADTDLASALLNQPVNKECFVEHAFKTQILAIEVATEMARGLTLTRTEIKQVGLAGLLQDLSLLQPDYESIVTKPRPLAPNEWDSLIDHPNKSLELVDACELPRIVREVIAQGHERPNGRGYPMGIGDPHISPLAKLLSAVNAFVAMVSHRPHRLPLDPHHAMEKLVLAAHHGYLDRSVVRSLLALLSIYPVGTLVKLDTGEVARVVSANVADSFRPVVAVVREPDGAEVVEPQTS